MSPFRRVALLALVLVAGTASAQVTGRGTEFWACWPRSHLSLETTAELVVMADGPTTAEIDGAFIAGPQPVAPGSPWIVPVPDTLRLASRRTIAPVGFRVRSTDPTKPLQVTLRVPRQAEASDDTARLLPVAELGTRYLVTSYPSSLPGEPSLYVVVATEDATTVDAGVPCLGAPDRVVLNRGEAYQVFCDWRDAPNDVTGAEVVADKPVAVFSGNSDAFVPVNYLAGDFILEQSAPVASWGTEFYVTTLPKGPGAEAGAHDIIRVVASAAGTLQVDEGVGPVPYSLSSRGAPLELTVKSPLHLVSDVPVDVHQFATGHEMTDMGDPFMAQVPALSHWGNGARAYVPPYYSLGSWLSIVTATAATASVRLDGGAVTGWQALPGGTHSWTMVDAGLQGERVVAGDAPLTVLVHGYNDTYLPDPGLGRTPGSHGTPAAHALPPCAIVPVLDLPATSCAGATLTLREAGSTASGCALLEYRWLENGVEVPGCGFSPTPDCDTPFRGETTYELQVRCASDPACIASVTRRVLDLPAPPVTLAPDPAEVCAGSPIVLQGTDGFVLYAWTSVPVDPGVTPRSSAFSSLTATPDVDTTYTLRAYDPRGCPSITSLTVTVTPDPLPPALDASVRVAKSGLDTIVSWQDLPTPWRDYEVVVLECATRDWRSNCSGRAPDPVTIQASPLAGPAVAPGTQSLSHAGALDLGEMLFYAVRATSNCGGLPGPTCNPWPLQVPPCP